MAGKQEIRTLAAKALPSGVLRLDFDPDMAFQEELQRRVDEYFETTGRPRQGGWRLYLKAALILACFATAYLLLVFAARNLWQGLALIVALSAMTALVAFNIQHDGGHQTFSARGWVNRLAAMTLDLIGGSSYVWHWKHTVIHHRYVNITWFDNDIHLGALARMSPHHRRLWYYRWQHLYLWPLYGLEAVKLQLVDDFKYVIWGRLGYHRIPRPRGWELALFIAGKAVFFSWAFAIPMLFHPWWVVLFYYVVGASVLGTVMVLIFALPHVVGEADFPLPRPVGSAGEPERLDDGYRLEPVEGPAADAVTVRLPVPWAVHQAQSTLDFARHNRVLTWLVGGLNYHKEHHLFPVVCHTNYPAISKLVEETCRSFGVPYKEHRSFRAGIVSHYRWLKRMGTAD
jgi:linoleoyl-CoA desaturase